jgi:hypothetical protein
MILKDLKSGEIVWADEQEIRKATRFTGGSLLLL